MDQWHNQSFGKPTMVVWNHNDNVLAAQPECRLARGPQCLHGRWGFKRVVRGGGHHESNCDGSLPLYFAMAAALIFITYTVLTFCTSRELLIDRSVMCSSSG